jgi:hypothetical protein
MKPQPNITPSNAHADVEHTRRELLKFLATERAEERAATRADELRGSDKPINSSTAGFNWSSLLGVGFSSWWHEHPARSAAMLLQSATSEYARKKPIQAVAVAAAAGAAIVLLRPWRMVSATALLLTLLRSSNFTGMASSVLDSAAQSFNKERP